MLKLSKETIKKIAINENIYYRGVRYYQNNAVMNVTWSKNSKQYRGNVKGGNVYTVTIDVKDDYTFDYSCNCPAHIKYDGACKHVVATLLFIEGYLERSEAGEPKTQEEKQIYSIIEYFNKRDYFSVYGETFRIETTITIPTILKGNLGKALVSLQVGNNRLYKVQNIRKFLLDYYNKKDISLGKEFVYISGESRFDKKCMKVMDYLVEILEIQECIGKTSYPNMFYKSQIALTQRMLIKLLNCIGDNYFHMEICGTTYKNVYFKKENLPVEFIIEIEDGTIKLNLENDEMVFPITDSGNLLYMNGILYLPENDFIKNYVPFYKYLGRDRSPLKFQGENKQRFLDTVLPKIQETMKIDIPDEMKDKYIVENLNTAVYLDRYKTYVQAKVMFRYGNYELNPLNSDIKEGVIILRQKETERIILDCLDELNFIPYKEVFILKNEDDIYSFLTKDVEKLATNCELYYSEAFKTITIRQPGMVSTSVRINGESDLLEVDISYDDIPREELKYLFQSLQLKKKYYRLKDGSFINLQHENALAATGILEGLNISSKNMQETGFVTDKSYALYLDSILTEKQEIEVNMEKSFVEFVNNIRNPEEIDCTLPEGIQAQLRTYQVTGFKWLKTLAHNNLGGILADDMGLGKTLQTIVYIASSPGELNLVVCPTSLIYNWQDEISNFAPFLRTVVITGIPEERKKVIMDYKNVDVIITSYPLIRRDIDVYKEIAFNNMFIDEAQFIKNPASLNAKSVKQVNAVHKFALTGTPIENSLTELWSIFDYIMPHYLLSHKSFVEQYERPILKNEDEKALKNLGKHIHPFILRRMKKDVLKELPEKIETKLLTELTEQQKKIYLSYMESIRKEIGEEIREKGFERSRMQILAALTRLRQICCHPSTFIENYQGGSGKLDLLMEQIPNHIANEHRILIFSQFTSMLQLIAEELKKQDIIYFCLEGVTKTSDRLDYVKRFNQGEGSVFLISLKAGGTGLNLVGADTVIHFDPWWNPAVEEQATDRVYRIGQKNVVHVIKLITKGTIEEKIYKLQKKKKQLSDSVIESKEIFINKLTREELEDIFQ